MGIFDVEDTFPYPCPQCGERCVTYDGMLVWRSGPRPPRNLARKQVGFSSRADYERERIYHCERCGAEFYQDMERRNVHLYAEGGRGIYQFDKLQNTWTHRFYDLDEGKWQTRVFDRAEGKWKDG